MFFSLFPFKVISSSDHQISKECIFNLLEKSEICFNMHYLSNQQRKFYMKLHYDICEIIEEHSTFDDFCMININYMHYYFAFNIMKFGSYSFTLDTEDNFDAFLVIHNKAPIYLKFKKDIGEVLGYKKSSLIFNDKKSMKITVDDKENKIIVGDRSFSINEESYLELFNANVLNSITY